MENTYTVKFYDMSEEEYENNAHLNGMQKEVEEFGEGYTIEDFYADRAGVLLEEIGDGVYCYEIDEEEKRYIIIID